MAKKVNRRILKTENAQQNDKKDRNSARIKNKKCHINMDAQPKQHLFFRNLVSADGIRPFSIAALAVLFGFFNSYHQATMFENDRHFSHLSSLEREMTFRTEMGLYYFYYKQLTESTSFFDGIKKIMNDNITEYPSTINTLERFTLYPEVLLAAGYRCINSIANFFNISLKECWEVLRGDDLPTIESCEGIGDPAYFYVTCVFLLNGLVGSLMFLYGVVLSNSISGGLLSGVSFFFNHGECTRVQWTPPLRESFGYPLFLLQLMLITLTLRCQKLSFSHSVIIAIPSMFFMLSWQFAPFALLTQILALFGLYMLNVVRSDVLNCILKGHLISLAVSIVFLFGNKMLISSLYTSTLIVCLVFQAVSLLIGCILVKLFLSTVLQVEDDAHIWNLLKSKFTSYRDFHTMLYVCAVEFDFLPVETLIELSKTFALPLAIAVVFYSFYAMFLLEINTSHENAAMLYNILQCFAFFIMAALVMRLKLFFSPHLCLLASVAMCGKFFTFLDAKGLRYYILFGLLGLMSIQGALNIKHQRAIIGEFHNPDLEELISWINSTLPENAVFAGPMPTMANILLSTRRPIVNHPHYENAGLRERTHKVYQIFSRKPVAEVHRKLLSMKINYIVLERSWCFGRRREGCAMVDLWDLEDPENKEHENVCQKIVKSPHPFRKVFRNSVYTVLAV
ncbi:probable C-mannosyltransferase DPY19L1 [Uloborus diversus]|uniref:probable C-mannosyltransferase DPY19L1 n=1 Tax=Uloborus diversus TaxID=327109 RepID=UPI002409F8A8|nr:probable C-mannosyltransferase DPY19L1 [Uloborus diversus]